VAGRKNLNRLTEQDGSRVWKVARGENINNVSSLFRVLFVVHLRPSTFHLRTLRHLAFVLHYKTPYETGRNHPIHRQVQERVVQDPYCVRLSRDPYFSVFEGTASPPERHKPAAGHEPGSDLVAFGIPRLSSPLSNSPVCQSLLHHAHPLLPVWRSVAPVFRSRG